MRTGGHIVGTEGAVLVALNNVILDCPCDRLTVRLCDRCVVNEVQRSGAVGLAFIAVNHGDELRTGDVDLGLEGGGGHTLGDALVVCPNYCVVCPVVFVNVREWLGETGDIGRAGHTVENGDEHCTGHAGVRFKGGSGHALHEAVLPNVFNLAAAPHIFGYVNEREGDVLTADGALDAALKLMSCGGDNGGDGENLIAGTAMAALGASGLGAGLLNCGSVDDLGVTGSGNDNVLCVGLNGALCVEVQVVAVVALVVCDAAVSRAGCGNRCVEGHVGVSAAGVWGHGEGRNVGNAESLLREVVDDADKLPAAVVHTCVFNHKSVLGAESLGEDCLDDGDHVHLAAAEVNVLEGAGLDPNVAVLDALELIYKGEIYLDAEACVLSLGNGDVGGTLNVEVTAEQSGDELENEGGIEVLDKRFEVKVAVYETLDDLDELVNVELTENIADVAVVADKTL